MFLQLRLHLAFFFIVFLFNALPIKADILVIAYNGQSEVALVDGATYKLLATLPTGTGPHEIRVSPDKRYAYIANSGSPGPNGAKGNSITVIDLKNRKVKANLDLGSYTQPHDVRVSRDGRRIWVACAPAELILELDADTGKILKTYKTARQGSWFLEITPAERKIYTPNLEGKSVSVINRATGDVKVIQFEDAVYGIDITPDGKHIWVSGRGVSVIDTTTDEVIAKIKTPEANTGRIRLTTDGKKAVVALSKKALIFDVKTRQVISEIELGSSPKVLTVSADNRRAFLTNPSDNSVTVIDIVAGKQIATFQTGKTPDGIAYVD